MTWVEDRIFAGGGTYLPAGWAEFSDQTGITAVLHLRPERPEAFRGPAPQSFLWLGLEDETQATIEDRWLAGRFVADCLERGQRVLLHSSLGRHRTRWVYVAWSIVEGRPAARALKQAERSPWLAPYHTSPEVWEGFAREVRLRRRGMPTARRGAA